MLDLLPWTPPATRAPSAASRLRQVGDGADYLEGWQGSKLRCFKCGGSGHFAKECTAEQQAQADVGALLDSSDDEGRPGIGGGGRAAGAPRLAGAPAAAAAAAVAPGPQQASVAVRAMSAASLPPPSPPAADPAEQFGAVLAEPSEEALTGVLRQVFGHCAFRGLQLPTVQRLLTGESLLSIMPTGMGKSLCYQVGAAGAGCCCGCCACRGAGVARRALKARARRPCRHVPTPHASRASPSFMRDVQLPALLLPGLTLVVSPLIALMHDQAASVPPPVRSCHNRLDWAAWGDGLTA